MGGEKPGVVRKEVQSMSSVRKYYERKGKLEEYRKIRERWKQRYRKRTGSDSYIPREWDFIDDALVLKHDIPDRELAKVLNRSVTAIQTRRSRLKHNQT